MDKKQQNPVSTDHPHDKESSNNTDVSTSRHASRFFVIGVILAIFNYGVYAAIANLIINNSDLLWLSSLIASTFTTILAFILHSQFTWKERSPGKTGIYKFVIWNIIQTVIVNPVLTQLFGYCTPLYDLAFNICTTLHIPFTYEFIQSTGAFVLTAIITMTINFLFYDKFVFGKTNRSTKSH